MEINTSDLDAIQQVVTDAERYQNDIQKFPDLLTSDVNLINFVGLRVTGREEVRKIMDAALKTALSDIQTKNELLDIRMLHPEVALVSCIKHIYLKKADQLEETAKASLTFVMLKQEGKWLIASAQNTPMQQQAIDNIKSSNIPSAKNHMDSTGKKDV